MKDDINLRPWYLIAAVIIILSGVAGFAGLFFPSVYENFIEPLHLAESQGQDFTTLFAGIPLLIISMILTGRGSVKGPLLWAGAAGYFLYVNLIYTYGGVYNSFFFMYIAICGLSLFSLIRILSGIDLEKIKLSIKPEISGKSSSIFFMITALLLIIMWGGMATQSIAEGKAADANVIIVTDFISVIPAFIIASVMLWNRKLWGYILSGVLFVQAVTLGISIITGQIIALIKGLEPAWGLAIFFLVFTIAGLILAIRFFKNMTTENWVRL